MSQKIRLVGLTLGDPFDRSTRSGVNYEIFSRFREKFDLMDVFDLDVSGVRKLILAMRNFSLNRREWGNRLHQNPEAFNIRTDMAQRELATVQYKFDLIYQDGAMFMPGRVPKAPYVSYHDSNVVLSARGKPYSQGAHYTKSSLEKTVKQEKMVYENATLIFSMSNWLKQSLMVDFNIAGEKIITVYAGTNLPAKDFDKTYDGRTVLFVGKNFERKGGKTLLEAFRLVRREVRKARLLIVGPESGFTQDGIEFLGPVNDKGRLARLFGEASVFVLPSFYEPFGIVFAEAFAHKTPCIGTNICAMPEIIEDGKGGFVIPPGDHLALANRIAELLKDEGLMRRMGEYGFKKAKATYNWDIVVEKMALHCSRIV